jgi:hypothetical protein
LNENGQLEKQTIKAIPYLLSGILIFYSGQYVFMLFFYVVTNMKDGATKMFQFINHNLNVILYGCFSIGFIIEQIKNKQQTESTADKSIIAKFTQ